MSALWKLVSAGDYDDTYECLGCKRQHTTQADSLSNQMPPVCKCPKSTRMHLRRLTSKHKVLEKKVSDACVGREARITDKNFNGQPYGRSRPKLKGVLVQITHAFFDDGAVLLWCKRPGHNECLALRLYQVEFLA